MASTFRLFTCVLNKGKEAALADLVGVTLALFLEESRHKNAFLWDYVR